MKGNDFGSLQDKQPRLFIFIHFHPAIHDLYRIHENARILYVNDPDPDEGFGILILLTQNIF